MSTQLQVLEAILFLENKPLSSESLITKLKVDEPTLRTLISKLNVALEARKSSLRIEQVEEGYCFTITKPIVLLLREKYEYTRNNRFSKAMLETLAIIAYTQPVTRAEIENYRGIQCSYIVGLLLKERLIEVVGKKNIPGNPLLYRTSEKFLHTFKLKSLKELPQLDAHTDKFFS